MAVRRQWAAARRALARTDQRIPRGDPYADTSTILAGRGGNRTRRYAGFEPPRGFVAGGARAARSRDPAATRASERATVQPGRDDQWLDAAMEDDRWC